MPTTNTNKEQLRTIDITELQNNSIKREILSNGNWIPCSTSLLGVMPWKQAIVLSILIDADECATERLGENNEWFKCDTSYLANKYPILNTNQQSLRHALEYLKTNNLIEVKEIKDKQNRFHRMIKLNMNNIHIIMNNYSLLTSDEYSFTSDELTNICKNPTIPIEEPVVTE